MPSSKPSRRGIRITVVSASRGSAGVKVVQKPIRHVRNVALPVPEIPYDGPVSKRHKAATFKHDTGVSSSDICEGDWVDCSEPVDRHRRAYNIKVDSVLDEWMALIPDLTDSFLAGDRLSEEPRHELTTACTCACADAARRSVRLVGLTGIIKISVFICSFHATTRLLESGRFPASLAMIHSAYSFRLRRFFRALKRHGRLAAHGFVNALLDFYYPDQTFSMEDDTRKQLARACAAPNDQETMLNATGDVPPTSSVCLGGNFTHKRRSRADAVTRMPSPPTFFLSAGQFESARLVFVSSAQNDGPRTGCASEVRAAVEGEVKASKGSFDVAGVVELTCGQGSLLLFCDLRETGEAHYYALALLDHLLTLCAGRRRKLGICYDIGLSLFYVFGHELDCQLKYSPRRTIRFGLTNGEAQERLWSALSDAISTTRSMSAVGRHRALGDLLDHICQDHVASLSRLLRLRRVRTDVERLKQQQSMETAIPAVLKHIPTPRQALANVAIPTGFPPTFVAQSVPFADLSLKRMQNALDRSRSKKVKEPGSQGFHLAARALHISLSQWHALDSFLKRRNRIASQHTQARLAAEQINDRIRDLAAMATILNTLKTVTRYAGRHIWSDDPWFSNPHLYAGLDAYEMLVRCDEEAIRIDSELDNMDRWLTRRQKALTSEIPEDSTSPWAAFVDQEIRRLEALKRHWDKRPPQKAEYTKALARIGLGTEGDILGPSSTNLEDLESALPADADIGQAEDTSDARQWSSFDWDEDQDNDSAMSQVTGAGRNGVSARGDL
ncbi:hypothetical protein V8E36_002908 [Tilletia maclaganii]